MAQIFEWLDGMNQTLVKIFILWVFLRYSIHIVHNGGNLNFFIPTRPYVMLKHFLCFIVPLLYDLFATTGHCLLKLNYVRLITKCLLFYRRINTNEQHKKNWLFIFNTHWSSPVSAYFSPMIRHVLFSLFVCIA